MKKYLSVLVLSLFVGCGSSEKFSEYFEIPKEMNNPEAHQKMLETYSPCIKGVKIFIDPGHGGEDRRTKSPNGLVTEADINLNVALALRDYLTEAGAIVTMSRVKDTTVDLKYRSVLANKSGCDIFISVHHNAPGGRGDNYTNYTSTYYHATENDYEFNPCNKDIARYIQRDIAYAMRNSGGAGSFDGTYSDYMIYPKAGFSVLRLTELPCALVEASFVTGRFEEQRLANETFNKVEGWGIFKGLCRYFKNGIPKINQIGVDTVDKKTDGLVFNLTDQNGIDKKSIVVQLDSLDVSYNFTPSSNLLMVSTVTIPSGIHDLKIVVANNNGNHSFPFRKKIFIK